MLLTVRHTNLTLRMKNLILCFSSIRPKHFNSEQLNIREKNYDLALEFLLKCLPDNWDVIYNDNTLSDISEIYNENLKSKLKKITVVLHKDNEGSTNKGAGEHDMCRKAFLNNIHDKYNWVVYFTARHIINTPWYFNMLDGEWKDFDSVMSNPTFHYLNYDKLESANNNYNDMLFAMKFDLFKLFVDSINIDNLKTNGINSEKHLYDFVKSNKNINNKEIDFLGLLRNDSLTGWHFV